MTSAPSTRPPAEGPSDEGSAAAPALWDAAAGRDREAEARSLEAAVSAVLARNPGLAGQPVTVTAGPGGLVTLTGAVATQRLRREIELSCWTVPGVLALHDELAVGR